MRVVNRVKGLLINKNNEIMLCLCDNQYQFPGGHVDGDESFEYALKRELKEETGIDIDTKNMKPFYEIHCNSNEYESNIYYYLINCNVEVDYNNTNYTKEEKLGNFEIKYVSLERVDELLERNINKHPKNKYIVSEMLKVLNEYRRIK